AEDGAGNLQTTPVKLEVRTAAIDDTTPPVWEAGYPQATSIAETGFTLVGKTDEAGSLYYAVLAKGATEPTSEEVENGTGAIKHGSAAMTAGTECSCAITELAAETDYDVYVVAEDNAH
ncbi:MAG TPA: hypothetical protein DDZ53_03650, partial [Firmicutes bacterium]|nr:hypothetical protein [Bacillota bacterium]